MEPREQRAAGSRAQHLLGCPKRVSPAWRAYHGKVSEVDAGRGKRRGIRQMRRREPDDALTGRGQRCERRHHDLQLADASKATENLGQRPARPTAAWELTIERAVSR